MIFIEVLDVRIVEFFLNLDPVCSTKTWAYALLSLEVRELITNFEITLTVDRIEPMTKIIFLLFRTLISDLVCSKLKAATRLIQDLIFSEKGLIF